MQIKKLLNTKMNYKLGDYIGKCEIGNGATHIKWHYIYLFACCTEAACVLDQSDQCNWKVSAMSRLFTICI